MKLAKLKRDGSPINRTYAAMIARGIDTRTASSLRRKNWTLSKLKSATDKDLRKLKLSNAAIAHIRAGDRPEIPFQNLAQVLIANRFTCCVCRNPKKSIILHHIREWAESHDHSSHNLAVVCLDHHEKAHSESTLSRNLTPALLRQFKAKWELKVKTLDVSAVLMASRVSSDTWLYFNHVRLFELARSLNVRMKKLPCYSAARAARQINSTGALRSRSGARGYMYEGGDGTTLYFYVRDVFEAVLEQITVLNISDFLERGLLSAVLKPGDFVLVQGKHNFSSKQFQTRKNGPGQTVTGSRRANRVEISFVIDRWESTSNSARTVRLSGGKVVASILRIVSVERDACVLKVGATAIAIAHGLDDLKKREYSTVPFRQGIYFDLNDGDLGADPADFAEG